MKELMNINFLTGLKEFKKVTIRDKIKKDYCINNNIQLIEFNKKPRKYEATSPRPMTIIEAIAIKKQMGIK